MTVRQKLHSLYMDLRSFAEPSFMFALLFLAFRPKASAKTKKSVFLLMTARHGNLGDQAIAAAEIRFLKNTYDGRRLVEFSENQIYYINQFGFLSRLFAKGVREDDLLFLHGGGNFGDLYPVIETMRRKLIGGFPKNKIILFPQSLSIRPQNTAFKKDMSDFYNGCPHVTLHFRDRKSFDDGKQLFHECDVRLTPDIATYLSGRIRITRVRGNELFFVLRDDIEKFHGEDSISKLQSELGNTYPYSVGDTVLSGYIGRIRRKIELDKMLKKYQSAKAVITDRFHGMVFAVITGTPCVAMRSLDHKITEGYKWFEGLPYIRYADAPEDVPEIIRELTDKGLAPEIPDFSERFGAE